MIRLAVDLDPKCELDYYSVHEIHMNNPLNMGSFRGMESNLDINFYYFQLLAVL